MSALSYTEILNGMYDATTGSLKIISNGLSGATSVTSVPSSATNVTILAANASRRGVCIYNLSAAILYLKLGATASTTSFTVKMAADSYYEVPFNYTGIIDGIWSSANGSAVVTEFTGG